MGVSAFRPKASHGVIIKFSAASDDHRIVGEFCGSRLDFASVRIEMLDFPQHESDSPPS